MYNACSDAYLLGLVPIVLVACVWYFISIFKSACSSVFAYQKFQLNLMIGTKKISTLNRERERERERERQTDRQTDRQTGRQAGRQTNDLL